MNKPNLFLSEHPFAVHKVNVMNGKYHLRIGVQFIIKHGYNRSCKFEMNAAVQLIHNKNSALFKCLNHITCHRRYLLCSCGIKYHAWYMNSLVGRNQTDLIHNLIRNIQHFLFWFFIILIHFNLNFIHIHILKVIHIQVCVLDKIPNFFL